MRLLYRGTSEHVCKMLWIRHPLEGIKYLILSLRRSLSSATSHATDCPNIKQDYLLFFKHSTLLCFIYKTVLLQSARQSIAKITRRRTLKTVM